MLPLLLLTLAGCPSIGALPIPCSADSHCQQGHACAVSGVCEPLNAELAPGLDSLSPASVMVGSPALTVTLKGRGFSAEAAVLWANTVVPAELISPESLSVKLPAALLATGGTFELVVANAPANGGRSNAQTFTVLNPPASINNVSPSSAPSLSTLTLKVTGSQFVSGSVVVLAQEKLPTTFVSSTELSAQLSPTTLSRSGNFALRVENPSPGGGTVNEVTFRVDPSIHTLAGGLSGIGGPAVQAPLAGVSRIMFGPSGELFYAEPDRSRVVRIDSSGTARLVAGTGTCLFSGDGAAATDAELCGAVATAMDGAGNLFIVEKWNALIRKIDTAGIISTVAGGKDCSAPATGPALSVGLGELYDIKVGASGALYVTGDNCGRHSVLKIANGMVTTFAGGSGSGFAGDNGPATAAKLANPRALALDAQERVYIADSDNNRVRQVDSVGVIRTVAGNGTWDSTGDGALAVNAAVAYPFGLWLDSNQRLYVSLSDQYRIRVVDLKTGIISAFAGVGELRPLSPDGTTASQASIGRPAGLAMSPAGELHFVSEHAWQGAERTQIMKFTASGTLVTVAGAYNPAIRAADAFFMYPFGVATDAAGNVFIADSDNDRIWKMAPNGTLTLVAGSGVRGTSGNGGPAVQAQLNGPTALSVDSSNNLYFTEWVGLVRRVDPSGTISLVAGGGDWPPGCPDAAPTSKPAGAGAGYNCIGDDYFAGNAVLTAPQGVLRVGNDLYITEDAGRVRRVDLNTNIITTVAGSTSPKEDACGFAGDNGPATAAKLCEAKMMALTPGGDLVVADSYNRRVRRLNLVSSPVGRIVTIAGAGTPGEYGTDGLGSPAVSARFARPYGLAFDKVGNLYISDFHADAVTRIAPDGTLLLVAGSNGYGWAGDSGRAVDALMAGPRQIAIHPETQALLITDSANHRIRQVGP